MRCEHARPARAVRPSPGPRWRPWAGALLAALLCLPALPLPGGVARAGESVPPPRGTGAGIVAAGGQGIPATRGAITELVRRPFPLIVPLAYRWARAAAWLNALETACAELPAGARLGLATSGLDDRAGLLALCARLHTLDHLTPDDSPELLVAVRLAPTPDAAAAVASAVREADLLAVQRALVLDLAETAHRVRREWPSSLAQARTRADALEAAALRLDGLWLALDAAREVPGGWFCAPESLPVLERAVTGAPENAAVWLLLAEARMQRDLPQAAVDSANESLRLLSRTGGAPLSAAAERLAARARYVRGLGHWRLGQPALAESDLNAALRTAHAESAPQGAELARRLRARGAVRMLRHDEDGMCADFVAACAHGDCEGLAVARGRDQCRPDVPAAGSGSAEAREEGAP